MVGSPFCGDSLHCAIAYICFVFGVFGGGAIWPFVGALIVLLLRGFAPPVCLLRRLIWMNPRNGVLI